MLDICVEVLLEDVSHLGKGAQWLQQDDIVAIYPATTIGAWNGTEYIPFNLPVPMPRTGWIFLTGVPVTSVTEITIQNQSDLDFTNPDDPATVRYRRCGWGRNKVPTGQRNKYLRDKYMTATWEQAKAFMEKRGTGVSLTDADLTAQT